MTVHITSRMFYWISWLYAKNHPLFHCIHPGYETSKPLTDNHEKKANAKATFFITGNNLGKGPINDPKYPWKGIIQVLCQPANTFFKRPSKVI